MTCVIAFFTKYYYLVLPYFILQNFQVLFEHTTEVACRAHCLLNFQHTVRAVGFRLHNYAVAQNVAVYFRNYVASASVERDGKFKHNGKFLACLYVLFRQQISVFYPIVHIDFIFVEHIYYKSRKNQIFVRYAVQVGIQNHICRVFLIVEELKAFAAFVHQRRNAKHSYVCPRELMQNAQLSEQLNTQVEHLLAVSGIYTQKVYVSIYAVSQNVAYRFFKRLRYGIIEHIALSQTAAACCNGMEVHKIYKRFNNRQCTREYVCPSH